MLKKFIKEHIFHSRKKKFESLVFDIMKQNDSRVLIMGIHEFDLL